jgi:hypothetical protein
MTKYAILIWRVFPVIWEVGILYAWGLRYPQTLFSSFFLCFSLVRIWKGFSAIISPSLVTLALNAVYGIIRSAGDRVKAYWFWVWEGRESWLSSYYDSDSVHR